MKESFLTDLLKLDESITNLHRDLLEKKTKTDFLKAQVYLRIRLKYKTEKERFTENAIAQEVISSSDYLACTHEYNEALVRYDDAVRRRETLLAILAYRNIDALP